MNRLRLPLPFFSFHAETVDVQAKFVSSGLPIGIQLFRNLVLLGFLRRFGQRHDYVFHRVSGVVVFVDDLLGLVL
jgi:hypothetical protein